MSRFAFFLGEAYRALRRNAAPSLAAIVTIAVTVLLIGVLVPVLDASGSKTDDVRSQLELKVFLFDDATNGEISHAPGQDRRRSRTSRTSSTSRQAAALKILEDRLEDKSLLDQLNTQPAAAGLQRQGRRPRQPRVRADGALAAGLDRQAAADQRRDRRHRHRRADAADPRGHRAR